MLQELELEADGARCESEIGAVDFDERCPADVRADRRVGAGDRLSGQGLLKLRGQVTSIADLPHAHGCKHTQAMGLRYLSISLVKPGPPAAM